MEEYYRRLVRVSDDDMEYVRNNISHVIISKDTITMNKELFIKMSKILNEICRVKYWNNNQYETIVGDIINWIIENYKSARTSLVKIKDVEYICIKSVTDLKYILCDLGYTLCTAEFLRELGDDVLLRDKGKYSRHGKNLPASTRKLLNINSRVIIFNSTVEYVNKYKKLCGNNDKYLYGLEDK